MSKYISRYFDHLSDRVAEWLGSTESILIHSVIFIGVFGLRFLDVPLDEILLTLTTALSLEAIYLAIFIQRAVNKQSVKLEGAIEKIINNVSENLEQPLDEVVGEIRQTVVDTHKALMKTMIEESDQVVKEVGQMVESETDELAITLKENLEN